MGKYCIYTDGGYKPKYNLGAAAFVILQDGHKICEFSKPYKNTTNQRMEQEAVYLALKSIKEPSEIEIYSDSAYVVKTYTEGWQRNANLDNWKKLDKEINKHVKVTFNHVRGHEGNFWNERADELTNEAVSEIIVNGS